MSLAKRQAIEEAYPSERPAVKLAQKKQSRAERRCWWTRPIGHRFKGSYCVYCNKFSPPNYGW